MADLSNLKMQIAEAIRANGQGAITGPVLQDQLLGIVDAMETETWGGLIDENTVAPSDITRSHVFIAVQPGEYPEFALTVEAGDVFLVARPADEPAWTMTNLAATLKSMIGELESGKQDTLTAGRGIGIDAQNNIEANVADDGGIDFDENGKMKLSDNIPTTRDMEEYVGGQKGEPNGIATLDGDGKVNEMPNDVAYFDEDGIDEQSIIDEYERILARLYQSIADVEGYVAVVQTAVNRANRAASNAEGKGNQALAAATEARAAATEADQKGAMAEASAHNADESAARAERAIETIDTTLAECERATARANSASSSAVSAAQEAREKGGAAATAAEDAATAAQNAEDKGDYAKNQGDAAKEIVDGSKGDYESLNDRLNAIESGKQDVISDIADIRSGSAKGDTAYQKPVGGIPSTDLSDAVKSSLSKANSAYQLPLNGIPKSDLSEGVTTLLDNGITYVEDDTFDSILG